MKAMTFFAALTEVNEIEIKVWHNYNLWNLDAIKHHYLFIYVICKIDSKKKKIKIIRETLTAHF